MKIKKFENFNYKDKIFDLLKSNDINNTLTAIEIAKGLNILKDVLQFILNDTVEYIKADEEEDFDECTLYIDKLNIIKFEYIEDSDEYKIYIVSHTSSLYFSVDMDYYNHLLLPIRKIRFRHIKLCIEDRYGIKVKIVEIENRHTKIDSNW